MNTKKDIALYSASVSSSHSYQNTYQPIATSFSVDIDESNQQIELDANRNDKRFITSCLQLPSRICLVVGGILISITFFWLSWNHKYVTDDYDILQTVWSADFPPYSSVDPVSLGVKSVLRNDASSPGAIFDKIPTGIALPTNSWCENFFLGEEPNNGPYNSVFQVPFVVDTGGPIQGIRVHPPHVFANDRAVMMTYEPENGLTLGSAEQFQAQHHVNSENAALARLAVTLEWDGGASESNTGLESGPHMQADIVRGSPYLSMEYFHATPRIVSQRVLSAAPVVDAGLRDVPLVCGQGRGVFGPPIAVQREIQLQFDTSDMTWLVFFSEPADVLCSVYVPPPSADPPVAPGIVQPADASKQPFFELKATNIMEHGMVRIALANNCSTGQNRQYCDGFLPRDQEDYVALLRKHADAYPTGAADIEFTFPTTSNDEEELRLIFDWKPKYMSQINGDVRFDATPPAGEPPVELLMYATPHHQQRLRQTLYSTNQVIKNNGCLPTIHGSACLVVGNVWSMVEHLHPIDFLFQQEPRKEMLSDIRKALQTDIKFQLPVNYMRGAGDTYFSGKMLAKLARIILHADHVSGSVSHADFESALFNLRSGVEVWLNGSAASPLLYDAKWGGLVTCGCDFNGDTQTCNNKFPDCPALVDPGQNFGSGFYNDHHFHFGYHIYAAAVLAKFDPDWGIKFFQHVLLLVRDIANPSAKNDPFFPAWRHKDWYLGFSWASGIVTFQGKPYPNGRNQESSSEAIHAYEAVALFGKVMADIFKEAAISEAKTLYDDALRVRDMGRLLLATEVRSARTYWHVQKRSTPGVTRIYPDVYSPDVVGMVWSLLVQEQTWFGNEPWKSYGIQLLPLTVASELRDVPSWIKDMLPAFKNSCVSSPTCESDGWSILVHACEATIGNWSQAWLSTNALPEEVFSGAGGNGHSRSNSLMHIATRRIPTQAMYELGNAFGEPKNDQIIII